MVLITCTVAQVCTARVFLSSLGTNSTLLYQCTTLYSTFLRSCLNELLIVRTDRETRKYPRPQSQELPVEFMFDSRKVST